MSSHRLYLLVGVALFLMTCQSSLVAQESGFAMKGVAELGGTVSYASLSAVSNGYTGNATTIFTFAPQVGYFVSDGFELGFSPGVSFILFPSGVTSISGSGSNSSTLVQLWLTAGYNFQTTGKKVFPFLEFQLGYTSADNWIFSSGTASGLSYGFKGGAKFIAVEHVLINAAVQYDVLTLNRSGATQRSGFNYLTIGVGVGTYL